MATHPKSARPPGRGATRRDSRSRPQSPATQVERRILTVAAMPGSIRDMREVALHEGTATDRMWREQAACLEFPAVLFFGADDCEPQAERRLREEQAKAV